jgi:hypothetical protein
MVWEASCEIISLGQNRDKILPLIKHLTEIKQKTAGLNMGGGFAPNQRFIDFAIKTIEFHKENKGCPCALFVEKFKLTGDSIDREIQYECTNPNEEAEKGNVKILDIVHIEKKWVDYYLAECLRCGQKFKVEEREYHYIWWKWTKIE